MVAFRLFSAEASGTLYQQWINLLQGAFDIGRDAVGGRRVLLVDDLYCSGAIATVFAQ
jgi:predicted amidophosphoribosyltransferase